MGAGRLLRPSLGLMEVERCNEQRGLAPQPVGDQKALCPCRCALDLGVRAGG